jgi:hypothetical protein
MLPDIYVDEQRLISSAYVETRFFAEGDCEIVEGCVLDSGLRRLLRFDTTTPNIGDGHLHLGDPDDNLDTFQWSDCHGHYHLDSYARYELIDEAGDVAAPGHKQAFCLMDFEPWLPTVTWNDARYHCGFQGISRGFADTYDAYLDCQFVDITDVPSGDYRLKVEVNFEHLLGELDYSNNVTEVPVTIP